MFSPGQMLCAALLGAIAGALVNGIAVRWVFLRSLVQANESIERLEDRPYCSFCDPELNGTPNYAALTPAHFAFASPAASRDGKKNA